ncbi:hypothetical protein Trydic_g16061 [Trypoxylus dichotomus]
MKFCFKIFLYSCTASCFICTSNSTKRTLEDDYYDYDMLNSNNDTLDLASESLILPNPESLGSKYTIDVLPNIELPDDSLADTDLRDHDFIDNLMYVYYGSHTKNISNYGPEIIIVGSVLSCAAQLLTIFLVLLRKNFSGRKDINIMFLHLMVCLCLSNLLFMLGVYAVKNVLKCKIIAVTLHYLHLLIACWLFFYCYYIYKRFCNTNIPKLHYIFSSAYGVPAVLTLLSFVIAPQSYEAEKFCFVSVQKGMIVNYMLPVSTLIILTTLYSLNGLENGRKTEMPIDNEVTSLKECKRCLKILCLVETSYDMVWFVAVLALENVQYSNSMSIVYSVSSCLLNWYIFMKSKSFLPALYNTTTIVNDSFKSSDQELKPSPANSLSLSQRGSSDNIPLLIKTESSTEMRQIRLDYISTISS